MCAIKDMTITRNFGELPKNLLKNTTKKIGGNVPLFYVKKIILIIDKMPINFVPHQKSKQ
jgi:hypothetical protein